ncbi:MAG: RHS repeat-associated core domain-containing protein [Planctomycetota bacterium]
MDPIRVRYRDASGEDRFTRVDVFGMYLEASASAGSTRPSPATTKVVRDAENRVQSEQFFDESLNQETATTYFYDDNGELEKIVEFDGSTSSFESKSVPHPVDSRFNYVYQSKYTAPDGTVTDYTFTNNGRNRETKLTVGDKSRTQSRTYDARGRLIEESDPMGRITKFTYGETLENLIRTDYPTDDQTPASYHTYEYDAAGNQIAQTNALNERFESKYDPLNRLIEEIAPDETVTKKYTRDAAGNVREQKHHSGNSELFEYDVMNRKIREVNLGGFESRYTYTVDGLLDQTIDGDGRILQDNDYNDLHQLTQTRSIDGSRLEYGYTFGQITSITDHQNRTSSSALDSNYREESTSNAMGHTVSKTYDSAGRVLTIKDEIGSTTRYGYDEFGHVLSKTIAEGTSGQLRYDYTYDAVGNQLTETLQTPQGPRTTRRVYDALNRVIETTVADGTPLAQTTTVTYNAAGYIEKQTEPGDFLTEYTYNDRGQQTRVEYSSPELEESLEQSYEYDGSGDLIASVDPLGRRTVFERTNDRMIASVTVLDSDGTQLLKITNESYDRFGNVLRQIGPDGEVIENTFDALGRNTSKRVTIGGILVESESTVYNLRGQVRSRTGLDGTVIRYDYDDADRVTHRRLTGPGGDTVVTEFDYYDNGQVKSQETLLESGKLSREIKIDPAGRVTQIIDGNGNAKSTRHLTYDSASQVSSETDGEGNITRFDRDVLGRVTKITYAAGTPESYTRSFEFNERNLAEVILTEVKSGAGTTIERTEFEYDGLNRRTVSRSGVGSDNPMERRIKYDKGSRIVEERVRVQGDEFRTETRDYDGRNRITQVTTGLDTEEQIIQTFTYDGINLTQMVRTGSGQSDTTKFEYDAANRQTAEITGVGTTEEYRRAWIFDSVGRVTSETVSYQAGDEAVSTTSNFSYDAMGRLEEKSSGGSSETLKYDKADRVIERVEAGGRITRFTYDALGNMISSTVDADGDDPVTHTMTYDAVGNRLTETTPAVTYRYDYNALNQRIRKTVDGGDVSSTESYQYDSLGRLTQWTDPNGEVATYQYDALGNLTRSVDPRGKVTDYTHDNLGRVKTIGGNAVSAASYDYDIHGNATERSDALSRTFKWSYDPSGSVSSITDPLGLVTRFELDGQNRLRSTINPNGYTETSAADAAGNVRTESDFANGQSPQYVVERRYDQFDRLTSTTVNGVTNSVQYLPSGVIERTVDPRGTTEYTFDGQYRLTELDPPGEGSIAYSYDDAGYLTTLTDQNGNLTTFERDGLGRILAIVDANGNSTRMTYDNAKNVLTQTLRDGREILNDYDPLGALERQEWTDVNGPNVISYQRNDRHDIEQISDAFGTLSFGYDAAARLSQVRSEQIGLPAVVVDTTYTVNDLVDTVTHRIGDDVVYTETNQYDDAGWLSSNTQIRDGKAIEKQLDYDAAGRVERISRLLNAVLVSETTYTYGDSGLLTNLTHLDGEGNIVDQIQYTRAPDGRVATRVRGGNTATYTYDAEGQVIGVDHSDPSRTDESYRYDAAGNPIATHLLGDHVVVTGNRVSENDVYRYVYDDNGNVAERVRKSDGQRQVYTWDTRSRLVGVRITDSQGVSQSEIEYLYDSRNRRIGKHVRDGSGGPGVWTLFVYAGSDDVTYEFVDTDGLDAGDAPQLVRHHAHGTAIDEPMASFAPGEDPVWYLADQTSSITQTIRSDGTVVDTFDYEAFGNAIDASANTTSRFGFTGREFDAETGLYHYRNRYYDAELGRFLSEDPTGLSGLDENLYRYVKNDPVNSVDPSGLQRANLTLEQQERQMLEDRYGLSQSLSTKLNNTYVDNTIDNGWYYYFKNYGPLAPLAYAGATVEDFFSVAGETVQELVFAAVDVVGAGGAKIGNFYYDTVEAVTGVPQQRLSYEPVGQITKGISQLYSSIDASTNFGGGIIDTGIDAVATTLAFAGMAVYGVVSIPVRGAGGILMGDSRMTAEAIFDFASLISPAKANQLATSGVRSFGTAGKVLSRQGGKQALKTLGNDLLQVADEGFSYANQALQTTYNLIGDSALYAYQTGKAISALRKGPQKPYTDLVSRVVKQEGIQLRDEAAKTLALIYQFLEAGGVIRDPLKAISSMDTLGKPFKFSEIGSSRMTLTKARKAIDKDTIDIARRFADFDNNARRVFSQADMRDWRQATDKISRFASGLNASQAKEVQALKTILNRHRWTMSGPWKELVRQLREVHSAEDFKQFLDAPFLKKELKDGAKQLVEKLSRGDQSLGLEPGDLLAFVFRGTGGASLESMAYRAQWVERAFMGDVRSMALQLMSPRINWRTIADTYKSPLTTASDIDFNVVIRGGGDKFRRLHQKSRPFEKYPNGKEIKVKGGEGIVDRVIKFVKDDLEGANQKAFMDILGDESVKLPIEIYVQDLDEFAKFRTAEQFAGSRLRKGGLSLVAGEDGAVRSILSRSELFDGGNTLNRIYQNAVALNSLRVRGSLFYARSYGELSGQTDTGLWLPADALDGRVQESQLRRRKDAAGVEIHIDNRWNIRLAPEMLAIADVSVWEETLYAVYGWWYAALGDVVPHLDLFVGGGQFPAGQLGEAFRLEDRQTTGDASPAVTHAAILLDEDAAGLGWFVDSTPRADEEFDRAGRLRYDHENKYDLSTVVAHEIGHVLGFSSAYQGFADRVGRSPSGQAAFQLDQAKHFGSDVLLVGGGNELDPESYASALMAATLQTGVRKKPGELEASILSDVYRNPTWWAAADGEAGFGRLSGPLTTLGFAPLAELARQTDDSAIPTGIGDPDFSNLSGGQASFWKTLGPVVVSGSTATVTEGDGMLSDLSQTFQFPVGAATLSFTLDGILLDAGRGTDGSLSPVHPHESFEVSLLNSTSGDSLLGEMVTLSGGDALLSVQADGTVYTAPGVTVTGLDASGGTIDMTSSVRVTVDLPDDAINQVDPTIATLYFDLVGFGDESSSVDVTDIQIGLDLDWQNPVNRFDVSNLGGVTPLDALLILNEIRRESVHDRATTQLFAVTEEVGPPPFYDVTGDNRITPLDSLQVLNEIRRNRTFESESIDEALGDW